MQEPTPQPRVLYSEEAIGERVVQLAAQISHDYAGVGDLLMVGVLRGAFIFLADLSRRLTVPRSIDFIALASYDRGAESGPVRLIMDLRDDIAGRHVLIVEDIVDTGRTMQYLQAMLSSRRPASLKACALVRKQKQSLDSPPVDYLGFEIPDVWVVGYGLDYANQFRTLPFIGVIDP